MTAGQRSEHMMVSESVRPGGLKRTTGQQMLVNRQNLLTDQDTEQTDERNNRRRWRTNAQAAVKEPDSDAGGQGNDINSHCGLSGYFASGRSAFARVTTQHCVCVNQAKAVGAAICAREAGRSGVGLAPRPIPLQFQ